VIYSVAMTMLGEVFAVEATLKNDLWLSRSAGVLYYCHVRRTTTAERAIKKATYLLRRAVICKLQGRFIEYDSRQIYPGDGRVVTLNEAEDILISKALESTATQKEAAKVLGISPRVMSFKLKRREKE